MLGVAQVDDRSSRQCALAGCDARVEDIPGRPPRRYCCPEHRISARQARRTAQRPSRTEPTTAAPALPDPTGAGQATPSRPVDPAPATAARPAADPHPRSSAATSGRHAAVDAGGDRHAADPAPSGTPESSRDTAGSGGSATRGAPVRWFGGRHRDEGDALPSPSREATDGHGDSPRLQRREGAPVA